MLVNTQNIQWCHRKAIHPTLHETWGSWNHFFVEIARTNEGGSNYIERATDQGVDEVIEKYKKLSSKRLNKDFGKTPQYWLIYTSMINQTQMVHIAIKTNDLFLKSSAGMTYFCYVVHTTFSSWKTWMHHILGNISSVRRNNTGIGQANDLAGEQIYMKSAKTTGKHIIIFRRKL